MCANYWSSAFNITTFWLFLKIKRDSFFCHNEALEYADFKNQIKTFRSDDDGICNDSRYFATVRRATSIPSSFNKFAITLSDKGFRAFSSATSFLIFARIAVEEAYTPDVVPT